MFSVVCTRSGVLRAPLWRGPARTARHPRKVTTAAAGLVPSPGFCQRAGATADDRVRERSQKIACPAFASLSAGAAQTYSAATRRRRTGPGDRAKPEETDRYRRGPSGDDDDTAMQAGTTQRCTPSKCVRPT